MLYLERIKKQLKGKHLIIVSNREPYIHIHTPDGVECKTPAGGLTAALDPVMKASSGTWVAWGSGDADGKTVDEKSHVEVPPEKPEYVLRRVWLNPEEVNGFYFGFANQTLWPLCHELHVKPVFEEEL